MDLKVLGHIPLRLLAFLLVAIHHIWTMSGEVPVTIIKEIRSTELSCLDRNNVACV